MQNINQPVIQYGTVKNIIWAAISVSTDDPFLSTDIPIVIVAIQHAVDVFWYNLCQFT